MSVITKEEAIRRTVVAQIIVAECQAAEALRDQLPLGSSTVYDNLFDGVDYTPERGWSIPQGDHGNELQPTTVTTLPEGCDLPKGSPVTEIVTPPGYEITSHEAEITGLIWKVKTGHITREQAAEELGVDLAEVDAENSQDMERMETLQPTMWTILPDEFTIAGVDTQTDGVQAEVSFVTRRADGTFERIS